MGSGWLDVCAPRACVGRGGYGLSPLSRAAPPTPGHRPWGSDPGSPPWCDSWAGFHSGRAPSSARGKQAGVARKSGGWHLHDGVGAGVCLCSQTMLPPPRSVSCWGAGGLAEQETRSFLEVPRPHSAGWWGSACPGPGISVNPWEGSLCPDLVPVCLPCPLPCRPPVCVAPGPALRCAGRKDRWSPRSTACICKQDSRVFLRKWLVLLL